MMCQMLVIRSSRPVQRLSGAMAALVSDEGSLPLKLRLPTATM